MTEYEFHKLIELLNAFEQALKQWNRFVGKTYEKEIQKKIDNIRQLDLFKLEEDEVL